MTKEGQGRRRPTLPPGVAVPSAQTGLTSLFGMERGGPRRHGHLDFVLNSVQDPLAGECFLKMTYVGTVHRTGQIRSKKYNV